jgi:hypothetical protein
MQTQSQSSVRLIHPPARSAPRDDHPELVPAASLPHGGGTAIVEWWPPGLVGPSTSGAQNGVRYACFPAERRVVIERNGALEIYDTGAHEIDRVVLQQEPGSRMRFTGQHGPVDLASFQRVTDEEEASAASPSDASTDVSPLPDDALPTMPAAGVPPAPAPRPAGTHDEVLDTIDRLAQLHQRGVLTPDEFNSKKAELLGRL